MKKITLYMIENPMILAIVGILVIIMLSGLGVILSGYDEVQ